MPTLREELEAIGFSKKGNITENDGSLELKLNDAECNEGNVYMWVKETDGEPASIIYIGMAGQTLGIRCKRWVSGLNGTTHKTAIKIAKSVKEMISQNCNIAIWARHSENQPIFGYDVSFCSVEEIVLIRKYEDRYPLLNNKKKKNKIKLGKLKPAI